MPFACIDSRVLHCSNVDALCNQYCKVCTWGVDALCKQYCKVCTRVLNDMDHICVQCIVAQQPSKIMITVHGTRLSDWSCNCTRTSDTKCNQCDTTVTGDEKLEDS